MNKAEESYLLWLKAVRENRRLRIKLMRKKNIHSERLSTSEAELRCPCGEIGKHAGLKIQ